MLRTVRSVVDITLWSVLDVTVFIASIFVSAVPLLIVGWSELLEVCNIM